MKNVTIHPADAGRRLDRFLQKILPAADRGFLYKMLRKKNITLNGKKADGPEVLCAGDTVTFFFSDETFARFRGEEGATPDEAPAALKPGAAASPSAGRTGAPGIRAGRKDPQDAAGVWPASLTVVYEDERIVAVNKPAGMLSQKSAPEDVSLCEYLAARFAETGSLTFRAGVANRLDRNTSGLVLAGKTLEGQQFLAECFRKRTLRKYYRTLVFGQVSAPREIAHVLTKDEAHNRVRLSGTGRPEGPAGGRQRPDAEEDGEVRIRLWAEESFPGCTLLKVQLLTGKSHQIRAQLAAEGFPVAGDPKYGDPRKNEALSERLGLPLRHQLLHAEEIFFNDGNGAYSGKSIRAPLPAHFERCLALLRRQKEGQGGKYGF